MRVLLVYPRFPDTFWSFRYALNFIGRRSAFPPLGLLTVAAMLPEAWGKRLVDLNVRPLRQGDLSWAECVFVYTPKHYYRRVRTFLQQYATPKVKAPVSVERILAAARSAVRLGILGRERFQYWRLLAWTALRRPSLISLAVTLAIYGHHFRTVSERHLR